MSTSSVTFEETCTTHEPASNHIATLQKMTAEAINTNNQPLTIICVSHLIKTAPNAPVCGITLNITQCLNFLAKKLIIEILVLL